MDTTPTFGMLFTTKKKSKLSDYSGIYIRITVNRTRAEISTKLKCPDRFWDKDKQRAKANNEFNYRHLNRLLSDFESNIFSIYQSLRMRGELITTSVIKNLFHGTVEEAHTLQKLTETHYITFSASLNPHTMKHYKTTYKYLFIYLRKTKKMNDIYLTKIDYQFINDYEVFLRGYRPAEMGMSPLAHNSVMRHMARLRTLINFAIKLGWMEKYPFKADKLSYKQTSRKYLTQEELDAIIDKDIRSLHTLLWTF